MIVKKELVVANRKKINITSDLCKNKFRLFPKVAKANASGETEMQKKRPKIKTRELPPTSTICWVYGTLEPNPKEDSDRGLLEQGRAKEAEPWLYRNFTYSDLEYNHLK